MFDVRSLFQDISVLGYCIGPLLIGTLCFVLNVWKPLAVIISLACVARGIQCSMDKIARDLGKDKRKLVAVPLILFFTFLEYVILSI